MRKLILLFTLIFSGFVFGQYVPEHGIPSPHPPEINSVKNEDPKIFDKVDKTPVFSSPNYNSFEELFTQNFDANTLDEDITRKTDFCEISIVCEIDGSVSSAIQISTTNKDVLEESLRTIKSFKKRSIFKPATVKGKPVRYKLKYRIEYDYKEKELTVKSIN